MSPPFLGGPDLTQEIVEQRERLETLQARERALRALRAREGQLEVDCIAAEAPMKFW